MIGLIIGCNFFCLQVDEPITGLEKHKSYGIESFVVTAKCQ